MNSMNANDIEKTTRVFLFLFFLLSSRAYRMDKPLSLIDIIPIMYSFAAAVFESCFTELLDDAIKIKLSCGIVA